jgi:hypothetical protein
MNDPVGRCRFCRTGILPVRWYLSKKNKQRKKIFHISFDIFHWPFDSASGSNTPHPTASYNSALSLKWPMKNVK